MDHHGKHKTATANDAWQYVQERPQHAALIEALTDKALGPGRFAKTAERLREGNRPVADLCTVLFENDELRASVRFWPIRIGEHRALLLGPLVVDPAFKDRGFGQGVMRHALGNAKEKAGKGGPSLVLLVGDAPYYAKAGFQPVPPQTVHMPGPVDLRRLLVCELTENAANGLAGHVRRDPQT